VKVHHPRNAHDDYANSVCGALHLVGAAPRGLANISDAAWQRILDDVSAVSTARRIATAPEIIVPSSQSKTPVRVTDTRADDTPPLTYEIATCRNKKTMEAFAPEAHPLP
jgi:hypothetical protein